MAGRLDKVNFETLGETEGVRDWEGLQILATFDNDNSQANITTSELTFVGPIGEAIINYVNQGAAGVGNGIFEGPDFSISLSSPQFQAFKGILDLSNDITINRDINEVKCKIMQIDGLNTFANISEAITYGLLDSKNIYSESDYTKIAYIKRTEFDFISTAIMIIAIFQVKRELNEISKRIGEQAAEVISMLATGLTGPLAASLWTVAKLLGNVLYFSLMLITLINMIQSLIDTLISVRKFHKGINMRTLITKACAFAGYTFSSSIPELDELYYLPIKTKAGKIVLKSTDPNGLPVSGGPMYTLGQTIGLVKDLFLAKVKIVDTTVHVESLKNESFWRKNSTYVLKDVKVNEEKYNTDEMRATKLLSFTTDTNDNFTLENYKGTVYEVKTEPSTFSDYRKVLLKGVDELSFPVALPTRKETLSSVETIFLTLSSLADRLIVKFGGKAVFANIVDKRKGFLMMSSDLVNTPKLMRLNNQNLLGSDYRTNWSAKYLYDNYHFYNSFVLNNYSNQYSLFRKIKMDASFQDFLDVISNNRATSVNGEDVEIESLLYNFGGGFWEADYKIKKIYTRNLKETYTEPE